jgi:hypothetical protein
MIARALVFVGVLLTSAVTTLAQQKEPIGRWVIDARLTSSGLPNETGWVPEVPSGTVVPGRGLGFEIGAHVYVLRWSRMALGVGATWLVADASASPPEPEEIETPTPAVTIPTVNTRLSAFAPQVSLNFGHSLGWSYLSAGLGLSSVDSEASGQGAAFVPRTSESVKTLNYGGGARWFINDHLGVGFDVRWHKLSLVEATATHPGAPRASVIAAGAGIVVK